MLKGLYRQWRNWMHHWHGEIIVLVELFKHPELPMTAKILIFSLLAYIISPIDIILDFIPFFGHWDDFLAIPIVLKLVSRVTPDELIERVRANVASDPNITLFSGRNTKLAAVLIMIIWVAITWIFIRLIDIERYLD